jgi:predicted negative regulator of RcsB-dependent stress response
MAVYDLEEQEQIDAMKAWWRQNGRLVIVGVCAAAIAFGGYVGWRQYRLQQSTAAAEVYGSFRKALEQNDAKKIDEAAGTLTDRYASTGYAALAALAAARSAFDAGDKATARTRLQWVMDHASEAEMQDVARLRLGAVLLDEKKYEEALKLVETKHAESFDVLYSDLKGDILAEQGKRAEARAAYQSAFDKSDARQPYRNLLQVKLDAVGDAK